MTKLADSQVSIPSLESLRVKQEIMRKLRSQNQIFKSEYSVEQKSYQSQIKEVHAQVGDLANNLSTLDFEALDHAYQLKNEEIKHLRLASEKLDMKN